MRSVGLTGVSDYLQPTLKTVIEHIHGIILARGRRHRHAENALDILVTLAEKAPFPLVDGTWIMGLLRSAAGGGMDDKKFILFMRLNARRKEEEVVTDVSSEAPIAEDTLFSKIMHNIRVCIEEEGGWRDEAVYGGLIAIRDIPGLGSCLPKAESLETLSKAMEKGEAREGTKSENKPFRIRKAAHDVIVVARDGWLKSAELRPMLEDLDIPRKLHSVVIETGHFDHQRSFLEMIEILSEDRYWHSYLRKATEIWLPFRHEEPDRVLRILTTIGELLIPGSGGSETPLDRSLEKLVGEEWARVPGRPVQDVTAVRLKPLAEITEQFNELLFAEDDRRAVLGVVEQVIPSLERRREDGYNGPGDDIRDIVNDLLEVLRSPVQSTRRQSTRW